MAEPIILASASSVRSDLLNNAGVKFTTEVSRIDEDAVRHSMLAASASPRDIADALATAKARKISLRRPDALVIGCDQVLELDGKLLTKPSGRAEARAQLGALAGTRHRLLSAVVVCQGGSPVWRHVAQASLTMRQMSPVYLAGYVERNWHSIQHAVGCYKLEEEGIRLFSAVEGDYFVVLGLPLIQLLGYLMQRKVVPG